MLNGKFIGVKEKTNTFTVEKKFNIKNKQNAVLKVTALGLYFAEINGVRVGDCYLTPGWTSYNKTLQAQSYDVGDLLKEGENVIAVTVNEGWYCGGLTWLKKRENYGKQPAVCVELVCDNLSIYTDESWTARESYIRESGIYDGETVDYTAELKPLSVCEVEFDKTALVAQQCEPVRDIERLAVREIIHTPNGDTVYDFGQNIAGVVEIITPEDFGGTLTLKFAEILIRGEFYTDNLRGAKVTDKFTVKGKKTLCPEFTFHGFRYLKITGGEIPKENITAIVRHTDMQRTGTLTTSNSRFNRLISNIVWGQRGNFVDIPTDCPQRDERLDWTFGIAYGDDYDRAKRTILEMLEADPRVLKSPAPFVALNSLGDSSVNILARAWVSSGDYWDLFFDMNERVYKRFAEVGLNIPFPQLDVHLKDETRPEEPKRTE